MSINEPLSITTITAEQLSKDRNRKMSGKTCFIDVYIGYSDNSHIIGVYPLWPIYKRFDKVTHLIVKAPSPTYITHKPALTPANNSYFDWTGEQDQYIDLEYLGESTKLSINSNSGVPNYVKMTSNGKNFNMPVVYYDIDPYWWLPIAHSVADIHTGDANFSIELDGTLSIDLYDEKSGDWLYNMKIRRNGKSFEGDIYMSKNSSPGKPATDDSPYIESTINQLRLDLSMAVQTVQQP